MDDHYQILGVAANASPEEIKERYRFLTHVYHPDRVSDPRHKVKAEEAFKQINEAYRVLSDPSSRSEYDRRRMPPAPAPPVGPARVRVEVHRAKESPIHRSSIRERAIASGIWGAAGLALMALWLFSFEPASAQAIVGLLWGGLIGALAGALSGMDRGLNKAALFGYVLMALLCMIVVPLTNETSSMFRGIGLAWIFGGPPAGALAGLFFRIMRIRARL